MEPVFERRRKGGNRTSRRGTGFSKGERRRLIQLVASLTIFAMALVGRNVVPERIAQWNDLLRQDIDFKSAFSDFGEATSQGEPLLDSLEELWVEVFAGNATEFPRVSMVFEDAAPVAERCREWEAGSWQNGFHKSF